jgi:soluble lytic murein transglycosylase
LKAGPSLGRAAAACGSLALVVAVLSPGCAGSAAPLPPPAPPPPAAAPVASAPLVAPSAGGVGAFAPGGAQPVLADPRLQAAAKLLEGGDPLGAAAAVEAALAGPAASPIDRARWLYLQGRLLAQAKSPQAASRAFALSAAEPWALSAHASLAAALEALRARSPAEALRLAAMVPDDLPISAAARLCQAEASEAAGAQAEAISLFKRYLQVTPRPPRWADATLKVGRGLLAGAPSPDDAEQALALARGVAAELPTGSLASRASELEREALAALPEARRAQLATRPRDTEATRLSALLDAGRATDAEKGLSELEASLTEGERGGELGCRVAAAHAKALGKMGGRGEVRRRRRAASDERYADAVARCSGEAKVAALFHAGAASSAAGRPAEAMARYEQLEKLAPGHRLADDARLKGALAALTLRDEARFSSMLERMAEVYPEGDMTTEGLFRLALHRIGKGDWAGAVAPLEASIKLHPREHHYRAAGRAPYFLARALAATGDRKRALALYRGVIDEHPLSYYMALAHARLAEADPPAAEAAFAQATTRVDATPVAAADHPLFRTPGFARAVELLRLGEIDLARAELSSLGLSSAQTPPQLQWAVAWLYSQSGADVLAHAIPAGRVADWLDRYPAGGWRKAWELAYPRPHLDVVTREARKSGIPGSLAYAIMREESVFDPLATSPAPAYGLMQFTLDTGKFVGKKLGLAIDVAALKTPAVSIALGCRFLSDLRARYPACPALAIPSYNAGPGNTNAWLTARPYEDLDVFVERIPFDETRNYTKRVLKSYAAYLFLYEPAQLNEVLRLPARTTASTASSPQSSGDQGPSAQFSAEE